MDHDREAGRPGDSQIPHQLAAAAAVFDEIVAVLGEHAPQAGHLIPPFAVALDAAATGRDYVIAARPADGEATPPPRPPRTDLAGQRPEAIADALAREARLLSARLAAAALAAAGPDREALAVASSHAAAVHDFLSGTGLWPPGQPWGSS